MKQKVLDLLQENPNISWLQSIVFKKIGRIDLEYWNGKFIKTEFDSTIYDFGESNFKDWGKYKGMLDKKTRLPSGIGRVIPFCRGWFDDGQFKDGDWHGYVRVINNWGVAHHQEMYDNKKFHKMF